MEVIPILERNIEHPYPGDTLVHQGKVLDVQTVTLWMDENRQLRWDITLKNPRSFAATSDAGDQQVRCDGCDGPFDNYAIHYTTVQDPITGEVSQEEYRVCAACKGDRQGES